MKVTWNGHACFTLELEGCTVVLDPYLDDYVPGVGKVNASADGVFCSHGHNDHKAAEVVSLTGKPVTLKVEQLHSFHDPEGGTLRGTNTIHIFHGEGLRAAHMGDQGCTPTPEQLEMLKGVDMLMIPVGGFYTIDAKQAKELVDVIQPRVTIPMHYRSDEQGFGFDVIGTVEEFTDLFDLVVCYDDNTIEVTAETQPHVAVPAFKNPRI